MAQVNCTYCGRPALLVSGLYVYPRRHDLAHKKFWVCNPCDARVGCHDPNKRLGYTGIEPKGRFANMELRHARMAAHQAFDPLWESGEMTRTAAYAYLAALMELPLELCHIGLFEIEQCQRVVEIFNPAPATQPLKVGF